MRNKLIGKFNDKVSTLRQVYLLLSDTEDEEVKLIKFFYNSIYKFDIDYFDDLYNTDDLTTFDNIYQSYFQKSGFIIISTSGEILKMDHFSKDIIFDKRVNEGSNLFDILNPVYFGLFNYKVNNSNFHNRPFITGILTVDFKLKAKKNCMESINMTKTIFYKLTKSLLIDPLDKYKSCILMEIKNANKYENIKMIN